LNRKAFYLLFLLFVIIRQNLYAEDVGGIKKNGVIVHFEMALRTAAKEVADLYPELKAELEKTIGWRIDFIPTILLIKNRKTFQRVAGSNLIVAYAVPRRNLIVIDYSKMKIHPFTIETTLKHELCHLLLHRYIRSDKLPKWLDEGIAQWVSDGMAEIIMGNRKSVLNKAILSGNQIPIKNLTDRFPDDRNSLLLAYEESKSIVEYIRDKYGDKGVLKVLEHQKNGDRVDEAILKGLSIPFEELERGWLNQLKRRITWFSYLSRNLYDILFFIAALLTILGFIKILMKKRSYKDEEWDDQ